MIKAPLSVVIALVGALLWVAPAAAQTDPTPAAPRVPFADFTPAPTSLPPAEDARLAACSAPLRDDFRPYLVRAGDTLAALLIGHTAFTPAQIAALNCLPDPDDLPIGAVVWLPTDAFAVTVGPAAASSPTLSLTLTPAEADAVASPTPENADPAALDFVPPPAAVLNDQPIAVSWAGTGDYAVAYLCALGTDALDCQPSALAARLPVSGSLAIGPFALPGLYQVVVEVWTAGAPTAAATQAVIVTCAQVSLAGDDAPRRCPDEPPRTVFAAYQPFERGAMIYFADTAQIFVLTDDQRFSVYDDVFVEGMPDPADPAPSGLITPVRGFGQVWRTLGGSAADIGFGLAAEQGYDAQRQPAARGSYTTYVTTPDGVVALTSIPGQPGGWWALVRE